MKKLFTTLLLTLLAAPLTFAQTPATPSKDSSEFKTITPLEDEVRVLKLRLDFLYDRVNALEKDFLLRLLLPPVLKISQC